MKNRLVRLGLLLVLSLAFYFGLFSDTMMKYLVPQLQIGLVGLAKALVATFVGTLVGMVVFPHKIEWDKKSNSIGFGGYARLIIILAFIYVMFTYA